MKKLILLALLLVSITAFSQKRISYIIVKTLVGDEGYKWKTHRLKVFFCKESKDGCVRWEDAVLSLSVAFENWKRGGHAYKIYYVYEKKIQRD